MRALEPRRLRHLRSSKQARKTTNPAPVKLPLRCTPVRRLLGRIASLAFSFGPALWTPSLVSRSAAERRYERLCGDVLRPIVINLRLAPEFGPTVAM